MTDNDRIMTSKLVNLPDAGRSGYLDVKSFSTQRTEKPLPSFTVNNRLMLFAETPDVCCEICTIHNQKENKNNLREK
jgi:hypothetical protein